MPLSPGTIVGRYQICSFLSAGQREIYLAHDTVLDREVAITLFPIDSVDSPLVLHRLKMELLEVSALQHPRILTVYDVGEQGGRPYFVTEALEGSLRDRLSATPIELPEALDIAIQIADALTAAHEVGIIHGDIRPENILLRRHFVKVADFGLTKLREYRSLKELEYQTATTKRGVMVGTVAYMSPEQLIGESVDARTDIWSLGVVLYEMITGHLPFERPTKMATIVSILHENPLQLTDYVSIELQQIVNKALSKDLHRRYQSTRELLADLREVREPERESVAESERCTRASIWFMDKNSSSV